MDRTGRPLTCSIPWVRPGGNSELRLRTLPSSLPTEAAGGEEQVGSAQAACSLALPPSLCPAPSFPRTLRPQPAAAREGLCGPLECAVQLWDVASVLLLAPPPRVPFLHCSESPEATSWTAPPRPVSPLSLVESPRGRYREAGMRERHRCFFPRHCLLPL